MRSDIEVRIVAHEITVGTWTDPLDRDLCQGFYLERRLRKRQSPSPKTPRQTPRANKFGWAHARMLDTLQLQNKHGPSDLPATLILTWPAFTAYD